MSKILIVYATAGIGHKKASFAVKEALDEIAPKDTEVKVMDSLDYTTPFFKFSYIKGYLILVNKLPLVWGLCYYLTDNLLVNSIVSKMVRFGNWLNSKRFVRYLMEQRPDVVVSTHFLASEVVADLKRKKLLDTHLVTVVTDYRLHSWWVFPHTDTFVVGSEDAKSDLVRWGIDPSRAKVLGIPAEPVFSRKQDRSKVLQMAGMKDGVFTVLVIGGGFGVGPIEEIVKAIDSVSPPVQIITICGHNKELVARLERLKGAMHKDIKILGFTDNVYDYMEISDVLISKSGGITVTESLAKELPMIIIAPILGQETRNADYLTSHNAALKIGSVAELKSVLEELASDPERMRTLKAAIHTIRRPRACYDVARLALDLTHDRP